MVPCLYLSRLARSAADRKLAVPAIRMATSSFAPNARRTPSSSLRSRTRSRSRPRLRASQPTGPPRRHSPDRPPQCARLPDASAFSTGCVELFLSPLIRRFGTRAMSELCVCGRFAHRHRGGCRVDEPAVVMRSFRSSLGPTLPWPTDPESAVGGRAFAGRDGSQPISAITFDRWLRA